MKVANVKFVISDTESKVITIKYLNFENLTNKIKNYLDSGIIVTSKMESSDESIVQYQGHYIKGENIKDVLIEFQKSNILDYVNTNKVNVETDAE